MKRAQLVAEAVAVLCPECGEAQPNREGSEMWTLEDFQKREAALAKGPRGGVRKEPRSSSFACVSCDVRFLLTGDTKVMFR